MATQLPEGAARLNLAVPPDIREQLETLAERHRRSLSAEVCCLVEEATRREEVA
jgi:hypothetical protein